MPQLYIKSQTYQKPEQFYQTQLPEDLNLIEMPKTKMEIRKEATFLVVFNKPMIKITIHSTTSNRAVVFSSRITQTFLNTGTTDQIFEQSGFLQTHLGEFS